MSNVTSSSEQSSVRRGFRIGLREQMALLGISGVLVTGAICEGAMHYESQVQRISNASNEMKAHVVSLSQSVLVMGQIVSDVLRRPTEISIKHVDHHERQLAEAS